MNFALKKISRILFGLTMLFLIVYKIGLDSIASVFSEISSLLIVVIIVHIFFQIAFSSYNVKILAKGFNYLISYKDIFLAYLPVWSLGKVMPVGLGELSLVYFLKRKELPTGDSIFIASFDKMLSFFTMAVISCVGVWVFFPWLNSLVIVVLIIITILVASIFFCSHKLRNLLKKLILRKYVSKFKGFSKNFKILFREKRSIIVLNVLVTFIKSLFAAITVAVLLLFIGVEVNPFCVLAINTISLLVAMIPITISGLGTREATAIYLFSFVNVDESVIFSTYFLLRIVTISVATIILTITWLKKRNDF